MGLSNS